MHAALITDTAWLADEQGMFRFLVVGLMGEQVRVAQVVPQRTGEDQTSAFGARLVWRDTSFDLVRRYRLKLLTQPLDDLQVDVLHGLDGRLWDGTLRLAERLGLPAVLSATCARDVARVASLRRLISVCRVGFSVATMPLVEAIRQRLSDQCIVENIPLGAHVPAGPNEIGDAEPRCVVVTGDSTFDADYQLLFEALADLIVEYPSTLFFFDCQGRDPHQLWLATRRFGLLSNSSMVPRHSSHRELLNGAHLLIQPQSLGRARSLTLQAMAHGVPVLARQDTWLDYLVDDRTVWATQAAEAGAWGALIRKAIVDGDATRRLGDSARKWVREHHLAASQVERTIKLYRRLTGETYAFPGDGGQV